MTMPDEAASNDSKENINFMDFITLDNLRL